jgi:Zn-dependent protease/CBS domain-containing protein
MFERSIELGKIAGIKIQLNWSLIIIFLLIAAQLGLGLFPEWHPDWSPFLNWTVALGAAVVFFGSLLLHELAHSLTAKAYGLDVSAITLFLFGGVSQIEEDAKTPWREFVIAIVGPLTSVVLGIGFLMLLGALYPADAELAQSEPMEFVQRLGPFTSILVWAGPINIFLGIFNMIPAFPLDGGRVLRSIFWAATDDMKRATRNAALVSRGLSWLFIGAGIAMALGIQIPLLGAGLLQGLWIGVIGWFIGQAARSSYFQIAIKDALEDVAVERLANSSVATVAPATSVAEFIDEHAMREGQDSFPVVEDGCLAGLIELDDVKDVPGGQRDETTLGDIMTPASELLVFSPEDNAGEAFTEMMKNHTTQALVRQGDCEFAGILRQQDVMKWLELHRDELES